MQTFREFLNEGFYSIKSTLTGHNTAKFAVSHYVDRQNIYIQFMPDSSTKDNFTTDQLTQMIKIDIFDKFKSTHKLDIFEVYNGSSNAAGILFTLNMFELVDNITTLMK